MLKVAYLMSKCLSTSLLNFTLTVVSLHINKTCNLWPRVTLTGAVNQSAVNQTSFRPLWNNWGSKSFYFPPHICKYSKMNRASLHFQTQFPGHLSNDPDKSAFNSLTCSSGPCPGHMEFIKDRHQASLVKRKSHCVMLTSSHLEASQQLWDLGCTAD